MKRTIRYNICLLVLFLGANILFSQNSKSIRFENIGINEGLSQSSVYDIVQDEKGFLWIATQDGLNKYDGVEFSTFYSSQTDSNSISSNTINTLCYDSDRNWLWIGSDKGINVLDYKTRLFKQITLEKSEQRKIIDIQKDAHGTIWVSTEKSGIFYFDEKEFLSIKTPSKTNNNIVIDGDKLIVSTERTGVVIDVVAKQLTSEKTYADVRDIQGDFWLVGNTIFKRNKNGIIENLKITIPQIKDAALESILLDGDNLWIGTQGSGLFLVDLKGDKLNHYTHQDGDNYSLGDNFIGKIYKDYAGIIWVCTDNSGFSKFDFSKQNIKHISLKRDNMGGLSSKIVWSITEDNNGNIFVGTDRGVDRINRFSGEIHNSSIAYKDIGSVHVINSENKILLGTSNSFYEILPYNATYLKDYFKGLNDSLFVGISIHAIKQIKGNDYWLGTNKGLIRFNIETRNYVHFNRKNSNLLNEDVRVIVKTSKNEWWLGTEGGLYKMFVISNTQVGFTSYLPNNNNPRSIGGSVITSIQEGDNGELWIGTYDGALNYMNGETKEFTNYSVKDGLSNNAIYGLLRSEGTLWISTNKGISALNEKDLSFSHYFESDGLQSNEFNAGAFYKSKNKELFFGGVNGVSHFYAKDLKKNSIPPKIAITKLFVNNESINNLKQFTNECVSRLKTIELNYTKNNLAIHFAALHFSNSKKNKYRYFIREIQDTSLQVSNAGVANYTSLAPGDYTFVAYCANGDGVWNDKPLELKIIINPPFWGTLWFQILAYSLLAFIIFATVRLRLKSTKRQKELLEKLVRKRTNTIFSQKEEIEKQKALIEIEKEKADKVLHKIFPDRIAEKLKNKGKVKAEHYKEATILFADFIQFTKISSTLTPEELVGQLNEYFKEFDKISIRNNLIQIKTIGDSYMAAGGIPKKNKTNAVDSVIAGLQIQAYLNNLREKNENTWGLRIGINTGEIVAGVLETRRPLYDIWGSAVNIASRIQDEGKAQKVNISEATYRKIKPYFICSSRGGILAKNVGVINMYFVEGIKPFLSQDGEGKMPNSRFWEYVNANIETSIDYESLEEDFLNFLRANIPEKLYYHSVEHTIDVIEAAERIGMAEGIFDERLILLKTAALIHDAGFIKQYVNNEPIGVEYAKEFLPQYGFSRKQIKLVCDLILATAVSFEPKTKLQEIIKDADLDYLGRDDFEKISDYLFKELLEKGFVYSRDEWDKMQLSFFKKHKFYTDYAKQKRVKKKQENRLGILSVNV